MIESIYKRSPTNVSGGQGSHCWIKIWRWSTVWKLHAGSHRQSDPEPFNEDKYSCRDLFHGTTRKGEFVSHSVLRLTEFFFSRSTGFPWVNRCNPQSIIRCVDLASVLETLSKRMSAGYYFFKVRVRWSTETYSWSISPIVLPRHVMYSHPIL